MSDDYVNEVIGLYKKQDPEALQRMMDRGVPGANTMFASILDRFAQSIKVKPLEEWTDEDWEYERQALERDY